MYKLLCKLLCVLALAPMVIAQTAPTVVPNLNNVFTHNTPVSMPALLIGTTTISGLSSYTFLGAGAQAWISNSLDGTCTNSGGTTRVLCYYTGSGWLSIGSGGGSYILPAAGVSTLGGVFSKDCSALGTSYTIQKINTDGTETCVNVSTSGMTNPMSAVGDTIYGGTAGAPTRLAGNTANSDMALISHGTGSAAAAPTYSNAPALAGTYISGVVHTTSTESIAGTKTFTIGTYLYQATTTTANTATTGWLNADRGGLFCLRNWGNTADNCLGEDLNNLPTWNGVELSTGGVSGPGSSAHYSVPAFGGTLGTTLIDPSALYLPNVFTWEGAGVNDIRIRSAEPAVYSTAGNVAANLEISPQGVAAQSTADLVSSTSGSLFLHGGNNADTYGSATTSGHAGDMWIAPGANTAVWSGSGNPIPGYAHYVNVYRYDSTNGATFGILGCINGHNTVGNCTTLNSAGYVGVLLPPGGVTAATYTSGGTVTGTTGQTCTVYDFTGGTILNNDFTAQATIALTGTNTIAGSTAFTIVDPGWGAALAPTQATLGSGTATCSGTVVLSSTLTNVVGAVQFAGIAEIVTPTTLPNGDNCGSQCWQQFTNQGDTICSSLLHAGLSVDAGLGASCPAGSIQIGINDLSEGGATTQHTVTLMGSQPVGAAYLWNSSVKSANYQLVAGDWSNLSNFGSIIYANIATVQISLTSTLPAIGSVALIVNLNSSNSITLVPGGSNTINGVTTTITLKPGDWVQVTVSTATNAIAFGHITPTTTSLPAVVYNTQVASTNAATSATTMVSSPTAGSVYELSGDLYAVDGGTGCTGTGSVALQASYKEYQTSASAFSSVGVPVLAVASTIVGTTCPLPTTAGGPTSSNVCHVIPSTITVASGTAVTFNIVYTAGAGCSTSQHYAASPVLTQLK